MNHNSMISGPKFTTSCRDRLVKMHKIMINYIFMMNDESGMKNIVKKQQTPYFHASATARENVKIKNNDFIIILDYANLNDMIPTTNYCSNPMEKFLGGSITHIESP